MSSYLCSRRPIFFFFFNLCEISIFHEYSNKKSHFSWIHQPFFSILSSSFDPFTQNQCHNVFLHWLNVSHLFLLEFSRISFFQEYFNKKSQFFINKSAINGKISAYIGWLRNTCFLWILAEISIFHENCRSNPQSFIIWDVTLRWDFSALLQWNVTCVKVRHQEEHAKTMMMTNLWRNWFDIRSNVRIS